MDHPIGRFVRYDMMSKDPDASRAFYTGLFGWTTKRITIEGFPANVLYNGDETIGALVPLGDAPIPSHWMPYVAVADAAETCAAIERAGGTVCQKPFTVPGQGTFAILEDPKGGYLSVIALAHPEKVPQHAMVPTGSFCWTQLLSSDGEAVLPFYREALGWQTGPMPGQGHATWTVGVGEGPQNTVGTVMQKPADAPADARDHWLGYVAVADIAASTARALELGAKQMVPPTEIPGMGAFAVLVDPAGAEFALWQNANR